jgi:O-antigen/teichoic acid export membrane protein
MTKPLVGKSLGAQAAQGARWTMLGSLCMSLGGYVIAVVLARGFGPIAYGVYGVVYSVLLASEQILRLGIPQALTRLIGGSSETSRSGLEATGVWLGVTVGFTGFVVLWFAAPMLADWLNLTDGTRLFRIAILDIPFFALYRVLTHILGGRRDFVAAGAVVCAYATSRAGGIVLLFAVGKLSVEGALIVNAIASVIGVLLTIGRIGRGSFRPSLAARATIVAAAAPILLSDIGIQCLLGVDLWLLSAFASSLSTEFRGEYVAAVSLARGPNIVGFVMVSVLIPLVARAWSMGERDAAGRLVLGTMRFLLALVVPACVLIAVNAGEVMVLFFGEHYRPGAPYLVLLVFGHGLGFTALSALQAIVIGIGHAKLAARRVYLALTAAVVMNLVLVPLLGAVGAATAAVLSFAAATALVGHVVRREIGVLLDVRKAALAVAVNCAIAGLGWLIPSIGAAVLVELAVLGLVTLAAMWAVGLILPEDLQLLLKRRGKSAG